jgi:hypothetical protein
LSPLLSLRWALRLADPFFFTNRKKKGPRTSYPLFGTAPLRQPMTIPPPEESVLVVKPGVLQGHLSQPGQPTSSLLLYGRSPARALDQTQVSPDQTLYQWATASEPPQPQAAREVPSNTFGSTAFKRSYVCHWPGCEKSYVDLDYLVRHIRTVHHNPSRYLCHFRRCPRSIMGRGFGRKDKLVDHLKSRKHDLSHEEALYEAAKHNVYQAPLAPYLIIKENCRIAEDTHVYQDKASPMAPSA